MNEWPVRVIVSVRIERYLEVADQVRSNKQATCRTSEETSKEMEVRDFKQHYRIFLADESGQDMIEFALVTALVGLGAIVAMKNLATNITNAFNSIGTTLTTNV